MDRFARGGLDALPHQRTGRPPGSDRFLSDARTDRIQRLPQARGPDELRITAPLWTRRAVGEPIRKDFGIVLAIRTVGAYLERRGFTTKQPERHACDQDPEDLRRRLEETHPALGRRAAAENAEIHGCDEVGVAADRQQARGCAPRGEPTGFRRSATKQRSALTTSTGTMASAVFLVLLNRLPQSTTGKVFLFDFYV